MHNYCVGLNIKNCDRNQNSLKKLCLSLKNYNVLFKSHWYKKVIDIVLQFMDFSIVVLRIYI